ncbi:hypothetical protein Malapachy_2231 [Malassezia pachydermatis]|uniref:Uncharacterized protein n=1 Tax=Malassezia pachydermatis TaxID=77020 RepID=A0A0M8MSD9_9BASI|nr:hypothetical protein Malapachy_2231 [Malassezia pachydermatis]KOS15817.1 hypothetical protein Malapachy_2231 [Malassezia pachydermatis]
MTASSAAKNATNWAKIVPVEVYPIIALTGLAVGGATWYISRLARSPDVIWDKKNNPTPWNNVEQGTQYKLMNINGKFDKMYRRDRL